MKSFNEQAGQHPNLFDLLRDHIERCEEKQYGILRVNTPWTGISKDKDSSVSRHREACNLAFLLPFPAPRKFPTTGN
jgi:hypothetical protein